MKKEKMIEAMSLIDDKYIKEAEPERRMPKVIRRAIGIAACFAIVIGLCIPIGIHLFTPFPTSPDLTAYEGSDYYTVIEMIEGAYYTPPAYKNNYEYYMHKLSSLLPSGKANDYAPDGMASGSSSAPSFADTVYGSVDINDNQVSGISEGDIVKRTDTHIYHLTVNNTLNIYSIDKESSETVAEYGIPRFEDENPNSYMASDEGEMFLSADGRAVTIVREYSGENGTSVGVMEIDVSEFDSIHVSSTFTIQGSYNSSRMVNGELLIVSEFYFRYENVDYGNPSTFIPSYNDGNGQRCLDIEDIILPNTLNSTRYSVVSLLDADGLSVLGTTAVLGYTDDIYVSAENIFILSNQSLRADGEWVMGETVNTEGYNGEIRYTTEDVTDIAIIGYGNGALEQKGNITVLGDVKDRWSIDECNGYLRVVASTNSLVYFESGYSRRVRNVSLYIYDLDSKTVIASEKSFAPDGEMAESVRFNGDELYVCTAEAVTFTDPVYFFDLSDYESITYTDTGVIDGYSTSLIDMGNGFLLGIGEEDREYSKVEVYEQTAYGVESVDVYKFIGSYPTEYKTYLIDRDAQLFGFGVNRYNNSTENVYILLHFDGYNLTEVARLTTLLLPSYIRGIHIDGYLYIVGDCDMQVYPLLTGE